MMTMKDSAMRFFEACESGKGWDGCRQYCHADATFSAQAGVLGDVKTVAAYSDWMKGMFTVLPDGAYEIRSFAADEERKNVTAYGVFRGTHTGQGGPVPPTGKRAETDYVYVMTFEGERIKHLTKIWNDGVCLQQLGWVS